MDKKKIVFIVGLVLVFAGTAFLLNQGTVDAQDCRIVRIMLEKGGEGTLVRIEPETIHISKGTCIIWINWVPANEVRIVFEEDGKKCQDASDSPVGFKMAENCYLTDFIPLGGTSSLRFNQEGTFKYAVEVPGQKKAKGQRGGSGGELKAKGEIMVE